MVSLERLSRDSPDSSSDTPCSHSTDSALLIRSELADLVLLVLLRAQLVGGEPVLQLAPPLLLDGRLRDGVEPQQAEGRSGGAFDSDQVRLGRK